MVNKRRTSWRLGALLTGVVAVATLAISGCGSDNGEGVADSASSEDSATSATTAGSSTSEQATSGTPTPGTEVAVDVYFSTGDGSDCGQVQAFRRTVTSSDDPAAVALGQLVAGPTDDEAGASSFFSADTASVLETVTMNDDLLVVDFIDLRPLIPNASTSCGSEALLAQLNSTVFQFDDVNRVRYLLEGSCDDFGNWLQRDCIEVNRAGQQLDVATNERASGSGCTPASGDTLGDGRWYGFVDVAEADQISFDLACWFSGSAAAAAAEEDGAESPPPNDYYIRNVSDRLRTVTVAPDAEVAWLPNPGDPASTETVTYQTWLAEQPGRSYKPGVWLVIEGGQVRSIEEQYVP